MRYADALFGPDGTQALEPLSVGVDPLTGPVTAGPPLTLPPAPIQEAVAAALAPEPDPVRPVRRRPPPARPAASVAQPGSWYGHRALHRPPPVPPQPLGARPVRRPSLGTWLIILLIAGAVAFPLLAGIVSAIVDALG